MGVLVGAALGGRDADGPKEFDRPLAGGVLADVAVEPDGLGDLVADRVDGVQRRPRVLEGVADAVAPDHPEVGLAVGDERLVVEADVAGHLDRVVDEPGDRVAGHRLATAALADETDGLAAVDREGGAVDAPDHAVGGVDVGAQVLDGQ